MSERPTKRRGPLGWLAARTWRFWTFVAVLTPVLYVLSSGPAAYLLARVGPSSEKPILSASADRIITGFYKPLRIVVMRPSFASRTWYRYVSLWVNDDSLAEYGGPVGIMHSPAPVTPAKVPFTFGSPPPD